jgi:hypothetical protein
MALKDTYYYSEGHRIELTPAKKLVALDLEIAKKAHLGVKKLKSLMQSGRQLSGNLYLVGRNMLTPGLLHKIDEAGAQQPVFQHGDTVIVVLPEVRAETLPGKQELLFEILQYTETVPVDVVEASGSNLVLRPKSGRGIDALHLANQLYENAHMVMAHPRFIRLVPKF